MSRDRDAGMDAARASVTLLVVLHHCAITYGASGGWYWHERWPDESWSSRLLVFFCAVNQAWFMGFFFLLAGYHAPAGLARRGAAGYLRERARRLGLPLLLYIVLIGPMTLALARTPRGEDFLTALLAVWRAGQVEIGPLWFCWALLLLAGLTALAFQRWPALLGGTSPNTPPNTSPNVIPAQVPAFTGLSNRVLWAGVAVTAMGAFLLRLAWPVGVTVAGLQLGYFAGYGVLYVAGLALGRDGGGLAERFAPGQRALWRRIAWCSLPVLPLVALLGPRWLGLGGRPEGGPSLLAAVYALWEPLVAWGAILALLQLGGRWAARAPDWWRHLAERSFGVFVLHPPVLVATALALQHWQAPALLKWACAGSLACLLSVAAADLLRRQPLLARVLA